MIYSTLDELRRACAVWVKCREHSEQMGLRRVALLDSLPLGTLIQSKDGRIWRVQPPAPWRKEHQRLDLVDKDLTLEDLGFLNLRASRKLWVGHIPWKVAFDMELPILRGARHLLAQSGVKGSAEDIIAFWELPVRLSVGFHGWGIEHPFRSHHISGASRV